MAMNDYEMEEAFREMLDDCYPTYRMGEMTFYPSDILKSCDPIAYRIGLSEYEDMSEEEDNDEEE